MTKITAAAYLAAMALAAAPLVITPTAQADVCGDVGGRHVTVGGCSDIAGDIAGGALLADDRYGYPGDYPVVAAPIYPGYPEALAVPSFPGEAPCYTPTGQPYFTPGDAPCYPPAAVP